jgi:hypothetical protein
VGRAWGGEREKKEKAAGWAAEPAGPVWVLLISWVFQFLFYFLSWFSNLNLCEFKIKFEFNPMHSFK